MKESKKTIFDKLDNLTITRKLYPTETIQFLTDLLKVINVKFDPFKKFNEQFLGRTKEEYEKMLKFIELKFNDTPLLSKEEGSVKFILARILESIIFKNLEIIYFYNLYKDEERRNIRTQLERALTLIYNANTSNDNFLTADEFEKIMLEGEIYEKKEIDKFLTTTVKKIRCLYTLKNNIAFNKVQKRKILTETFTNLEYIDFNKPEINTFNLKHIEGIITSDFKKTIKAPKKQLNEIFLEKGDSYYLTRTEVLKKIQKNKRIIIDVDLDSIQGLNSNNKLLIDKYDLTLNLDQRLLDIYLTITQRGFIRKFKDENKEENKKEYNLNNNLNIYKGLLKQNIKTTGISRYGTEFNALNIYQIEIDGRIYKDSEEITEKIIKLNKNQLFKIKFNEKSPFILVSKNLNYFYLLNSGLISSQEINNKVIPGDQLCLRCKLVGGKYLIKEINKMIDETSEDYQYEYQDVRAMDVFSKGFSKNDILKYNRESKTRIDKFEKEIAISKLIPKSLLD